jgi:hypothetical protein
MATGIAMLFDFINHEKSPALEARQGRLQTGEKIVMDECGTKCIHKSKFTWRSI